MAKQIMREMSKKKILNKVIATFLVVALTFSNVMTLGFHLIAGAKVYASNAGELEMQDMYTQNNNVEFDAYFMSDSGTKSHSTLKNFGEEEDLYLEINIKEEGYLKNGKVDILDANFHLLSSIDETDIIQGKGEDSSILLKQLNAGTTVMHDILFGYKKENTFKLDDFNKVSTVRFTGTYVDKNGKEIEINKEIKLNVEWTGNIEMVLDQEIIKYVPFTTDTSKGVLVQYEIKADIKDRNNSLPIKNTVISTVAPSFAGFSPVDVKVASSGTTITNGQSLDNLSFGENNYTYNKETGELIIEVANTPNENGVVFAGQKFASDADTYLVSYIYGAEAYDKSIEGQEIIVENKVSGDVYAYNNPNRTNPYINSAESFKEYILSEKIGNMVEYEIDSNNINIPKGHLYNNFEAGENANETGYNVNWYASIGNIIGAEGLIMRATLLDSESPEYFYDYSNVTRYVKTSILKTNFDKILGEDGFIDIYNVENGEEKLIGRINKDSTVQADGTLVVEYSNLVSEIIVKTSAPIEVGKLKISHTKVINKNIQNIYAMNYIKGITHFVSTLNYISTEMAFEEPHTNAILEINKDRISANNVNENVEIKVTLQKNGVQYNLFKNPIIYIEFPFYVEDIDAKDLNILFADGLEIDMSGFVKSWNEDGNLVVTIPLKGNQTVYSTTNTVGTQVILNTNIIVRELTPSVNASIKAYVYNEKATAYRTSEGEADTYKGNPVTVSTSTLDFVALTGMITKGKLTNFDNEGTVITTKEDKEQEAVGVVDTYNGEKTANMNLSVLNNNGENYDDVRILGRFPVKGNKEIISGKDLNSTFNTIAKNGIKLNGIEESKYTVYYSENVNATEDLNNLDNRWTEDLNSLAVAKSYLIKFEDYVLEHGNKLEFGYNFTIPGNLEYDEASKGTFAVLYNNDENNAAIFESVEASGLGVRTDNGPDLAIEVYSSADISVVHEQEIIKYTVIAKNTGNEAIENAVITGIVPEGTTLVKWESPNDWDYEYVEYEGVREVSTQSIEKIEPGKIQVLEYRVKVNNLEGGNTNGSIQSYGKMEADNITELRTSTISNTVNKASFVMNMDGKLLHESNVRENSEVTFSFFFKKITADNLDNIKASLKLPEEVEYIDAYIREISEDFEETHKRDNITFENGTVTYSPNSMEKDAYVNLRIVVKVNKLQGDEYGKYLGIVGMVIADGIETHRSNEFVHYVQKVNLEVEHVLSHPNGVVKEGRTIEHTVRILNNSGATLNALEVKIEYPEEFTRGKISPASSYKEERSVKWVIPTLTPGEAREYKIILEVNELSDSLDSKTATIKTTVKSADMDDSIETATYTIEKSNNSGNNGTGTTDPDKRNINGTAFIDANSNGKRDSNEYGLPNVKVLLIGSNNELKFGETTTNSNGEYTFKNIAKGEYFIIFLYDSNLYELTTYKASGTLDTENSKVTGTTLNINNVQTKVATTDKIEVKDSNIYYMNMGVLEKQKFDLKLDKSVASVTVTTTKGTAKQQYDGTKLAKIDLNSKLIAGTEVMIEYRLTVTNNGDVPGYAKKIVDYMPTDIIFSKDLNPTWVLNSDGNIYNTDLSEILLQPGESKSISLIIIKNMTADNTGLITNTAEIAEDYNSLALRDTNSTPANRISGENDMSIAEVLITVATGRTVIYLSIIIVAGIILGAGIFIINRRTLIKYGNI